MKSKIRKRILYSILISFGIHLGFLLWSLFVRIVDYSNVVEKSQRYIHVRIANLSQEGQDSEESKGKDPDQPLTPDNPFEVKRKTGETSRESKDNIKDRIDSAVSRSREKPKEISGEEIKNAEKPQLNNVMFSRRVMRSTRRHLVEIGEVAQKDFAAGSPVVVAGNDISKDFLDKSDQFVRKLAEAPARSSNTQDAYEVMKKGPSGMSRRSQGADLGAMLTYELFTYQEPETGQRYFKLLVKVKDAMVNFPVLPKEIIFLVDASQSIGDECYGQFQKGLVYSLDHLNPEDRFNVIVFKDKAIPFSPGSLKADKDSVSKAINFLKTLKAGSKTDVYSALNQTLNLKDPFVPSYRVLISDGVPTEGVTNTRQVINQITDINMKKVSIFAFGGGMGVSRYMLDFLAYKNRGWSQYVDRDYFIGRDLGKLYDKIRDPILLNLRYHVNGVSEKNVFPQILPDFFKGSEFIVYGTYKDENKFVLQLLGDLLGERKEFFVHATLSEAMAGDKEIARQWAFHKVYYLIGQLKHNEKNEALIKEIDALCSKYAIVTPYSKNFR